MTTCITSAQDSSVGAAIWGPIKAFKDRGLNIVETPSVGYVRAPAGICALLRFAVSSLLQLSQNRGSRRIRVLCSVDHRRMLKLRIADDGDAFPIGSPFPLLTVEAWAGELDGTAGLDFGPDQAAWLAIPLPD